MRAPVIPKKHLVVFILLVYTTRRDAENLELLQCEFQQMSLVYRRSGPGGRETETGYEE